MEIKHKKRALYIKSIFLSIVLLVGTFAQSRAQTVPSLIPLPQKLSWNEELFPLHEAKDIVIHNDSLQSIAKILQQIIRSNGYYLNIQKESKTDKPIIELKIGAVTDSEHSKEAY